MAPDSHASVGSALYSVPYRYVGQVLEVRLTDTTVQFFKGEELVKTHPRIDPRRRQTDPGDLPPDKVAFYQRTPQWCLKEAANLGVWVRRAVEEMLSVRTLYHLRQAQGLLRMGERYGSSRLNAACGRALSYGDPSYRTIKTILERGLDRQPLASVEARDSQVPAFLHGQQQFAWPETAEPGRMREE